jgi:osmotically inducible protein OsmC
LADIERASTAVWRGDLRNGEGVIDTASGALDSRPYTAAMRFEQAPGTNPEELIAAAHAACYNMAFAGVLAENGYPPEELHTRAVCHLTPQRGGYRITRMRLVTHARVPGIDDATLQRLALEGGKGCPVSNLLREGLEIELSVTRV